jgi:PAS domain S-box-containing protein
MTADALASREITELAEIAEARADVARATARIDPALVDAAQLVASELLTNALLHGGGRGRLSVTASADGVRIAVADDERRPPIAGIESDSSMTGRGLRLVAAMSAAWGYVPLGQGKEVWAEITPGGQTELDTDDLFALWEDEDWDVPDQTARYDVILGEVPTDLLLRAKWHVDNLVREFTLAASGADSGATESLPVHLAELIDTVVHRFAEARDSIKRQAVDAYNAGIERTRLHLRLSADAADAGEAYLVALDEVDSYCRAMRLLTLETPPEHRVFRQWYVEEIVRQVRAAIRGDDPGEPVTFEQRLLEEISAVAAARRRSDRAGRLYAVAVALAAATTPDEVTKVVLHEGVAALGARGAGVVLPATGSRLTIADTIGYSSDVVERLRAESPQAELPAAHALRNGEPVWLESRDEILDRFPDLPQLEDSTVSLCAVPLVISGRRLGALRFSFDEPRLFDEDERRFVEALAAQCADALDRLRLERAHEELQRGGAVSGADAVATLEDLFDALPALVAYLRGPAHVIRFANGSSSDVFGGGLVLGRPVAESVPAAIADELVGTLDEVWASGLAVSRREVRIEVAGASPAAERYLDFTFQPVRRGDGSVEGVLAHAVDVTEAVLARRALEQAAEEIRALEAEAQEDRFRLAIDSMLDPVLICSSVVDADGRVADLQVEYLNDAARRPRRAGTGSSVGRRLSVVWPGIAEAGLLERYVRVAATGEPLVLDDFRYVDPLGRRDAAGVFDIRATRIGEEVFIVYRDVTDRAERERELVDHREALAEAQRIARMGSWVWDTGTGETTWSDELYEICGFERIGATPTREAFLDLLDPEDRAALVTALDESAASATRFQLEPRLNRRDGSERHVIITGEAVTDATGETVLTRGTVQDVTEQREAELALRHSQQRLREEHDAVQILQAAILPAGLPSMDGGEVVARYLAASENVGIGGDFYDVFALDADSFLVTVGDVAGKGIQAAEAVGQLRNGLRMAAAVEPDPAVLVRRLNQLIALGFSAPFATAVIGIYRPSLGRLDWASAGHLPLAVRRRDGTVELVGEDPTNPPLGVADLEIRPPWSVVLEPGEALLLFTDGLVERRGEALDVGLERLRGSFALAPADAGGLADAVLAANVGDIARQDDVCLVALVRAPAGD